MFCFVSYITIMYETGSNLKYIDIFHSSTTQSHSFACFIHNQIQEFMEFRVRLDNSLQCVITNAAMLRLETLDHSFDIKNALNFYEELNLSDIKYDSKGSS